MECLDTYDENKKFIGKYPRDVVHRDALWHNTVHCWLYVKEGNVYFQIRKEEQTFYTTASGHVDAGETIKKAFGREIKEEIGINVDYEKAILLDVVTWKMDKIKKDGSVFKDRAFANVYALEIIEEQLEFDFDPNEVSGLVMVNAKDALKLFQVEIGKIPAKIIKQIDGKITFSASMVDSKDFLVNEHETAIEKYGAVLNKIIELTS